jgi:hypothetical protein
MSQFSHKDYIWLANAWHRLLGAQPCATDRMILIEAIEQFADLLAEQSPGFNKRLFIDNCLIPLPGGGGSNPNKGHCNG